jgi:hypothetical protein
MKLAIDDRLSVVPLAAERLPVAYYNVSLEKVSIVEAPPQTQKARGWNSQVKIYNRYTLEVP